MDGRVGLGITLVELEELRSSISGEIDAFLSDLEVLVNIDCGSYTKSGVDEVGSWVHRFLQSLGAKTERIASDTYGDTVIGYFEGDLEGRSLLLLGHTDTVFEPGTVAQRPFRVEGRRAFGPGVTDCKAGVLAGLYAIRAVHRLLSPGDRPSYPWRRLAFVANPDEEIDSIVSGPIIERLASEADAAFVLECARANGDIVSSRKGSVEYNLSIKGRAAHAGLEPEKGRNAIVDASAKVIALDGLNRRWDGVTVNVGLVSGGTRPNVVPAEAALVVEVRAPTRELLTETDDAVRAIANTVSVPGTTSQISEHFRHWPMEKLAGADRLIETAVEVAKMLGFPLEDAATGGVSDGNTTVGQGVPTLDGLGPIGGGDHSVDEYLELDSIVDRTTLLAGLLLASSRDDALAGTKRRPPHLA